MGKSGEQFLAIRELEAMQYEPTFSKKEAIKQGKKAAKEILDRGEVTPTNALSNLCRFKEFINALESELRGQIVITETHTENGVEFSLRNTGDRLDYEKDPVVSELQKKLKDRQELVKLATKSGDEIYDSEGVRVEKVPVKTVGKQVVALKF